MDTPADRIAVCLEDAAAVGMITTDEWYEHVLEVPQSKWTNTELQKTLHETIELAKSTPEQPAYIIYTSGSNRKPKGIVITQKNICHFLRSENSILGIQEQDKVYQGFSVAFDMSFEEIWLSYLVEQLYGLHQNLWLAIQNDYVKPCNKSKLVFCMLYQPYSLCLLKMLLIYALSIWEGKCVQTHWLSVGHCHTIKCLILTDRQKPQSL